jgi:hypothetical protein
MASIPGIKPATPPMPTARVGGADSDGDNDGTKGAAEATPLPTPVVIKPTETMGNSVNAYA